MKKIFQYFCLATALLSLPVPVNALIEAPHNQAAIGSCGNCHGQHLADSPFWGGAPDYNTFCWVRCHSNPSDRVSKGPAARTHSSSTTNSLRATLRYLVISYGQFLKPAAIAARHAVLHIIFGNS